MTYPFLTKLPPERRGRTTERVARILRSAVSELQILPGEFIDKAAICDGLGVSRFPVSEALSQLAAEGLVEILPQRGTRAAPIQLSDVGEAMMIRRALEAAVAEKAAREISADAMAALDVNLIEQRAAVQHDDMLGFHALDLAFHELLVDDLGLARVAGVIDSSRANIDRVRRLLLSPNRLAATVAEHERILAAIAGREPAAARAAMEAHLDSVLEDLHRYCAARPDAFGA